MFYKISCIFKNIIFIVGSDFSKIQLSAAILADIAVIAEKFPSGFFMPKVSRSQNKCQNSSTYESPRAYSPAPGL